MFGTIVVLLVLSAGERFKYLPICHLIMGARRRGDDMAKKKEVKKHVVEEPEVEETASEDLSAEGEDSEEEEEEEEEW
jgi:hypothetical protein